MSAHNSVIIEHRNSIMRPTTRAVVLNINAYLQKSGSMHIRSAKQINQKTFAPTLRKIPLGLPCLIAGCSTLAANPTPPGTVRHQVYSRTAAEIFWERASDDGIVQNKVILSDILVDAAGKTLNTVRFETSLEIENGKDHRNLRTMMQAINDPNRSFDSVLDQYFNRASALAWVSANILLRQADAVRHSYILYNPTGGQKFFFIPWDYDEAMGVWQEAPNSLSNDSLRQRFEYGYGLASGNVFLEKYYRLPGTHNQILQNVQSLRQNRITLETDLDKVTISKRVQD